MQWLRTRAAGVAAAWLAVHLCLLVSAPTSSARQTLGPPRRPSCKCPHEAGAACPMHHPRGAVQAHGPTRWCACANADPLLATVASLLGPLAVLVPPMPALARSCRCHLQDGNGASVPRHSSRSRLAPTPPLALLFARRSSPDLGPISYRPVSRRSRGGAGRVVARSVRESTWSRSMGNVGGRCAAVLICTLALAANGRPGAGSDQLRQRERTSDRSARRSRRRRADHGAADRHERQRQRPSPVQTDDSVCPISRSARTRSPSIATDSRTALAR